MKQSLAALKNFFLTGSKPTQAQFADTLDSFRHKDDPIQVNDVDFITWNPGLMAGMAGWYDFTDAATVTLSGSLITGLADKGNNKYNLNNTAGQEPTYHANGGPNNHSYATFANGKLLKTTSMALTQPYAVYAVLRQTAFVNNVRLLDFNTGGVNGLSQHASNFATGFGPVAAVNWIGDDTPNFCNTDWSVFKFDFDNVTPGRMAINSGPYMIKGPGGSANMVYMQVGATAAFDIAELVFVSGQVSITDDIRLRSYLLNKHNVGGRDFVIGFGDSITQQSYLALNQAYFNKACNDRNKDFYNYAISGTTVNGATDTQSLQKLLFKAFDGVINPNGWVVIAYGTNDGANAYTGTQWQTDFEACVQQLIDFGYDHKKIIITTPPFQNSAFYDQIKLNAVLSSICTNKGTRYCDMYSITRDNGGLTLLVDGKHPNATGSGFMTTQLKTILQ